MTKNIETHILKLSCKDQIGIVANISSILAKHNCNIVESKQFTDQENGHFFIRQTFTLSNINVLSKLEDDLLILSNDLNAEFFLSDIQSSMNTIMLVSKFDHCLNDILYRVRNNSLNLKIKAIVSNHKIAEEIANFSKIPFYYFSVDKSNKEKRELKIKDLIMIAIINAPSIVLIFS